MSCRMWLSARSTHRCHLHRYFVPRSDVLCRDVLCRDVPQNTPGYLLQQRGAVPIMYLCAHAGSTVCADTLENPHSLCSRLITQQSTTMASQACFPSLFPKPASEVRRPEPSFPLDKWSGPPRRQATSMPGLPGANRALTGISRHTSHAQSTTDRRWNLRRAMFSLRGFSFFCCSTIYSLYKFATKDQFSELINWIYQRRLETSPAYLPSTSSQVSSSDNSSTTA